MKENKQALREPEQKNVEGDITISVYHTVTHNVIAHTVVLLELQSSSFHSNYRNGS